MAIPIVPQNLGSNLLAVLLDVRSPEFVVDDARVLGPDIERWQLRFAAKGVAAKDVGEDGGTIDQRCSRCCDHFRIAENGRLDQDNLAKPLI